MKHLLWIPVALAVLSIGCKKDQKTSLAAVSTTNPANISATGAQSGGTISSNGGTTISSSGICWATHTNPSVSDSIIPSGISGTGTFSVTLANLNANTVYYVRAFVINGVGTAYGNVDSFTTSKGLATVTTAAITNNLGLQATSGGTVTGDGGATVTARGICWSTSPHPTTTNSKTSDGSGTGSFVDSMTNLTLTTFYVRTYATNSFGTAYGNEISFLVSNTNTVSDIDGNVYRTVTIGGQTWMTSNLKVTHYKNGDTIINGLADNFDWRTNYRNHLYVGAYTFPNKDSSTKATYGLLYNGYAINDSRGLDPAGWHVPTLGEWETLQFNLGVPAIDTANSISDPTAQYAPYYQGSIAKFLPGGSSGLNLQLAGQMLIAGSNNYQYALINTTGVYLTSSSDIPNGTAYLANWSLQLSPTASYPIVPDNGFVTIGAIRCVKN